MEYIESQAGVAQLASRLDGTALLAADTEAAGYHRYRDRVCLVQLSTRTETFVVDTLAVTDLRPLASVFDRAETEVVFHDADYDLRLLDRDFGLHVGRLFDTKIAAQFLGEPAIGLGALAEKYLAITLQKKHQRADWAQRPLPAEMLEYAAEDTRHLPVLRDRLLAELQKLNRDAWAQEEFSIMQRTRWGNGAAASAGFLRTKGARDLSPRQLAALRELHAWREGSAEARDVAPFRVLSNEAVLEIARALPRTIAELSTVKGISAGLLERRGAELLAAVQAALRLPEPELPTFPRGPRRPPPDALFEERMERLRAVRDQTADELAVDRGFLMPRTQLEAIARVQPKSLAQLAEVPEMRKWQIDVLGKRLIEAMR
ncbi:MAG TPA: HRDC domain-containing protein [Longimicrobiales bacterium]|nr:HRDC domain-containing protein [Longimicrobiales bacterium]